MTNVKKSYFICALQRTGSTLLARSLIQTRHCGQPLEYILPKLQTRFAERWSIDPGNFDDYLQAIKHNTASNNGVVGMKLMFGAYRKLMAGIRNDRKKSVSDIEILNEYFPDLRFVYLTRENKIRQAISAVKLQQSRIATANALKKAKEKPSYHYDKDAIAETAERYKKSEERWEKVFKKNQINPFRITYESFTSAYKPTLIELVNFLEIPMNPDKISDQPPLEKLADRTSEEWYLRYQHDSGTLPDSQYQEQLAALQTKD